jgi:predicted transcriptional regulator
MAMTEHPLTGKARLMRVEGRRNLKRVRSYIQDHPGAKQVDVAEALGLSVMAVNRHFKAMRREWKPKGTK